MPARFIPFVNGQTYHVYNRGVEKRRIFENRRTHSRFLQTAQYYQLEGPKPKFSNFIKRKLFKPDPNKKIVEILSYCLMPNHFHFLIKQLKDGGVSEFISKLTNSYTKFYNIKFNRVGPLLQGQFKAVLIESDEQLVHVSRYIHLNPLVSYLVKDLDQYEWSSYKEYIGTRNNGICTKEDILDSFKTFQSYKLFVLDQASYATDLERMKHKLLDGED